MEEGAVMSQEAAPQAEAAPNYDTMDHAQLQHEAFPNEFPAPVGKEQATEKPEAVQQQQEVTPKPTDDIPAWFKTYEANMKRELGSYRGTMSEVQKLQKLVHQAMAARQDPNATQDPNSAPQTPEEAKKLVEQIALQAIQSQYGGKVQLLEQLEQERADSKLMQETFGLVGDKIANAPEVWQSIFKEKAEAIENGDEAAYQWMDRALKNPELIALAMLTHQSNQVQSQAQAFSAQKAQAASKAAQNNIKAGGVAVQGKKALSDMSQDELDSMSTDELRKRTQEEGHFRG